MKAVTFKDWDLDRLDDAFGLTQIWQSNVLAQWEQTVQPIDAFEAKTLHNLQQSLIRGGRAWNEVELENKFISPVIMTANIDDEQMGYFLERPLKSTIGDYELSGIVDGLIATGIRNPHTPYFCLHEYKRSVENQGTPDAQVLAAMLVASEINNNQHPIYGLFIVGLVWNFIVLEGNQYCISQSYNADADDLLTIFKMLKTLKQQIIQQIIEPNS